MATTTEDPDDRDRPQAEGEPESWEPRERLDLFYGMIRTRSYSALAPTPPDEAWNRLVFLRDVPPADREWNDAYEAEQLLSLFVHGSALIASFDALEVEAREHLKAEVVDKRVEAFRAAKDEKDESKADVPRRAALQALAEDLHEHWVDEDERGEYYRRITKSTAVFLVGFIVILVAAIIALIGVKKFVGDDSPSTPAQPVDVTPQDAGPPSTAQADSAKTPDKETPNSANSTKSSPGLPAKSPDPVREFWFDVALLLAVVASGLFGAGLSMLTSLNARLEAASMSALERMDSDDYRLARSTVGAGAALVLFGMCWGGLLGGNLMPKLNVPVVTTADIDMSVLAHLLVLCILAGFSEKLVPTKLGELEK